MGAITIKWTRKDVGWWKKKSKLEKIFMFYHLKSWQSWQVVSLSFIWMLENSDKKSTWWIFKFKFWFKTFENEHLLHQKESISQRTIKRTHIIVLK
jgi:hypothetical protein